tara:strand:- start:13057 stop:13440 length:384 start_codon:yes stop_codon:yes gene_type:complete
MEKDNRPVYLNLIAISLPVIGKISILHRISGFALFLTFPFMVWFLSLSLRSEADFLNLGLMLQESLALKLMFLLVYSGFIYHLLAGIKKILGDAFGIGETIKTGTIISWVVLMVSLIFIITYVLLFW